MGEERFWDAVYGDDTNSGSSTAMWKTFTGTAPAAFIAAPGPQAKMVLGKNGIFRPTVATLATWAGLAVSGTTELQILSRDMDVEAKIQGAAQLANDWTETSVGSGIWEQNIGTGKSVGACIFALNETFKVGTNGELLRQGVQPVGTAGSLTDGQWAYTSGTGVFQFNTNGINAGANPADAVYIVRQAAFNLVTVSGTGNRVAMLDLAVAGYPGGVGAAYCLQGQGCVENIFERIRGQLGGNHVIGFTSGASQGNLIHSCMAGTCNSSSTLYVLHGATGNITGRVRDCVAHSSTHFKADGTDFNAAGVVTGFFTHADPATSNLFDIEHIRCKSYHYGVSPNHGAFVNSDAADQAVYGGSASSTQGRHIRWIECESWDDRAFYASGAPLYQRCKLRVTKAGPLGPGVTVGTIRTKGSAGGGACPSVPLFDACEIIWNSDNASSTIALFQANDTVALQAGEGPTLINCSVIDIGTGVNAPKLFDCQGKANFAVRVYGSLLGATNGKTVKVLHNDSTSSITMSGNVFCGISSYSSLASRDTFAELVATVDPLARVFTVAQLQLLDPATGAEPGNASPLWEPRPLDVHTVVGLNKVGYVGSAGAYQAAIGGSYRSLNRPPRVARPLR